MFLDEASLVAQLNHPASRRVFDLGPGQRRLLPRHGVRAGFDLMTSASSTSGRASTWPRARRRVVADASTALHHAHEPLAETVSPLNIIHRDVTRTTSCCRRPVRASSLSASLATER